DTNLGTMGCRVAEYRTGEVASKCERTKGTEMTKRTNGSSGAKAASLRQNPDAHVSRAQFQQEVLALDGIANLYMNLGDDAVVGGVDGGLHFHRLEGDELVPLGHFPSHGGVKAS